MAKPTTGVLTPAATVTISAGESTDASSEFWQQVTSGVFIVYEGVPWALAQNLMQHRSISIDSNISQQLAGYPRRVSS